MTANVLERLERGLRERYRIEREIGRGGMAIVYLASDLKHDRPVALKVFRPEMGAHLGGDRFLREIRLTAQLQHPGILALHDSGEVDGLVYYVMPFIEGESLRERLTRERQLPVAEAVRVASEVAEALDYAHARGIVHRDVKPENIMLSQGHALVGDFGIARAVGAAGGDHLTEAGITVGTVGYMSPEQATAEVLDARSDQYSLACVVYEMLVGQPPFAGTTGIAIISRHLIDPAPPLRGVRPDVTEGQEQAFFRAMAKMPADRYATVREFAAALASGEGGTLAPSSAPTPPARSVAVLPFADLSPKRDQEYFCDGLSETLQEALSHVDGLRVVSRTSAFAFKDKRLDVREIGRRLNVVTLLEGSVQTAGERLRASVTLTNAADGYQLWSERYDRPMIDVFDVQDDIARTVVRRLLPKLTGALSVPLAVPSTDDLGAYQLYLKGRHVWNRRTEEALHQSITYFRRALALDSTFARAQAGLADAYAMLGIYGALPPDEAMTLAKRFAEDALAQNPNLAEARAARGCVRAVYEWDWSGAEADFRQALAANPQYPPAYQWYAVNCLMPLGRFPEARARLQQARELDPLSPVIGATLGLLAYLERRYDEAAGHYREVLELDERFPLAHYFLGQALTEQGKYQEAVARLNQAGATGGRSAEVLAALARAEAMAGRTEQAEALLGELKAMAGTKYVSTVLLAQVHLALGHRTEALESLEQGLRARSVEMIWLGVRRTFDTLRNEPRFIALLREIGLLRQSIPTEAERTPA
jgi:eukaryotic-like serine/threonine-protein kinase